MQTIVCFLSSLYVSHQTQKVIQTEAIQTTTQSKLQPQDNTKRQRGVDR